MGNSARTQSWRKQKISSFQGSTLQEAPQTKVGSNVTLLNVGQIPGLNTLGSSLASMDFAPNGALNPPHTHPRATEILVVVKGILYVGFVASNQDDNSLFTKVLNPGDVYVFPIGMIQFQLNVGKTPAVASASLGSQTLVQSQKQIVFGSDPPINPDVLSKAFQLDKNVVAYLHKQF